jgi:hypothetical protein
MAEGRLIGTCMPRHRHQEWVRFLELVDRETPPDLDLHLIVDNDATHKHPKVKRWLARQPCAGFASVGKPGRIQVQPN